MTSIEPRRQALIDTFLEYNKQINLSAIRDTEGVYLKHILDSLELLKILDLNTNELNQGSALRAPHSTLWSWLTGTKHAARSKEPIKIADIGTGGGFPLLPLAMTYPNLSFVWIDSVRKKIQAIGWIAETLGIKNLILQRARIEDIQQKFDVVTARAVAHVEKLLPWAYGLLKSWSKLVLYKEYKQDERAVMLSLLQVYKLKLIKEHRYSLFDGDIHRVIYILERI